MVSHGRSHPAKDGLESIPKNSALSPDGDFAQEADWVMKQARPRTVIGNVTDYYKAASPKRSFASVVPDHSLTLMRAGYDYVT